MVRYRLSSALAPVSLHLDVSTGPGFTDFYRWQFADLTGTLGAGYAYDNEWETLILSFADATITGSPTRSGITAVRLRARDAGTGLAPVAPFTVQWQEVSVVDEPAGLYPNGVATICFDDGYLTQFTNAMPVMTPLGFRATAHIIRDALGLGTEMTLAQVQSLQDDLRWEVGCHADTGTVHAATDIVAALPDVELDYRHQKTVWRQSGLAADRTFAYPSGEWNPQVVALAKRYYQSARLNFFKTQETFPPAHPWKLRACGAISSAAGGHSAATVNAAIDAAAANRSWLILIFHKIVTSVPAVTTECALADFQSIMTHLAASGMAVRTTGEVMRSAALLTAAAPAPLVIDTTDSPLALGTAAHGSGPGASPWNHVHPPAGLTATAVYRQATSALTPSATISTFGATVTQNPGSGFAGIFPVAVTYVASGVATETVTVQSVVTWSDSTTTTAATTTTANATTNLSASQLVALMAGGDGKHATSIAWSVKSSIGSSTASVTVTVLGLNQY